MKKLLVYLFVLLLVFAFVSCSGENSKSGNDTSAETTDAVAETTEAVAETTEATAETTEATAETTETLAELDKIIESGDFRIGIYGDKAAILGFLGDKDNIKSIEIPKTIDGYTVTAIGDTAFYCCKSLENIEIPNSVTSIGDGAFSWCTLLASIEIPSSVTSIGDSAFFYCESLTIKCEAGSYAESYAKEKRIDYIN